MLLRYLHGANEGEPVGFCSYCGAKVELGDEYCGSCGKPVKLIAPPANYASKKYSGDTRGKIHNNTQQSPAAKFQQRVFEVTEEHRAVNPTEEEAVISFKSNSEMNLLALSCPKCGGEIQFSDGKDSCFCPYCGAQVILDRGERIVVHRQVDEAKIRQLEIEKERFALEKARREEERRSRKLRNTAVLFLAVLGLLMWLFSYFSNSYELFSFGLLALAIALGIAVYNHE